MNAYIAKQFISFFFLYCRHYKGKKPTQSNTYEEPLHDNYEIPTCHEYVNEDLTKEAKAAYESLAK